MTRATADRRAQLAAVLVALLVVTAASVARASSYDLQYRASAGCPDLAGFVAQISKRSARARYTTKGADNHFSVRLVEQGAAWKGELVLGRGEAPRIVSGVSCTSVAEALALIIAVELQRPSARPRAAPPRPRNPAPVTPAGPPRPAPKRRGLRLTTLGTGAVVIAGPAPTPLLGGSLFAELGTSRKLGPALRLGVTRATTGIEAVGPGHVRFVLSAARVEGCPFALGAGDVGATACLGVVAGVLHADGVGVARPGAANRSWVDAGPLFRAAWPMSEPVHVELDAGFAYALTRRTFVFSDPEYVVYAPPGLISRAGIFLAGALP